MKKAVISGTGTAYSYVLLLLYFFMEGLEFYNIRVKAKINSKTVGNDSK